MPRLLAIAFLLLAAASLAWTASLPDGIGELWIFLLYAGLFGLGAELRSLKPVYVGLGLGLLVNGPLMWMQVHYGVGWVDQASAPGGLFMRANYAVEAMALTAVGLIGQGVRWWWLAAALIAGTITPLTFGFGRGAFAGTGAAIVVWLWPRYRATAFCVALAGIALCATQLGTQTVAERFEIWRDTIAGLTWMGRGLGSYFVAYPEHASLKDMLVDRPAHAHNDFLELLFELGPLGLGLFVALLLACLRAPRLTERAVLATFIVEACFAFPLHFPVTGFVAALAAGHLCGAWPELQSHPRWLRMAVRAGTAQ